MTLTAPTLDWPTANQRYLMAEVRLLRHQLEAHYTALLADNEPVDSFSERHETARRQVSEAVEALPGPSALDTLTQALCLSRFERSVLLLCAAAELDAQVGPLLTAVQGGGSLPMLPTFSLALSLFTDPHWNAITPDAALRYWRLVDLQPGPLLTKCPLKIDEQVLHYLTGVYPLDERLREVLTPASLPTHPLVASQRDLANQLLAACSATPLPLLRLDGTEVGHESAGDLLTLAATVARELGLYLYELPASRLPTSLPDLNALLRLWNRESVLHAYALYIDTSALETTDRAATQLLPTFLDGVQGLAIVGGSSFSPKTRRPVVSFPVGKPTPGEQLTLWQQLLGSQADCDTLREVVSQFNLSARTIRQVGSEVARQPTGEVDNVLWRACCTHARPVIDELAQRIEPMATWADIVLPNDQLHTLHEVVMQVRQRSRVYGDWGFGSAGGRGLGISVLFAGESGTGKTMAAEVLANELNLDLYRIDLSQVVNKYIGETEKNLRRIFDAAEAGGAILLFDEADALFGKRSEVRDSHDRHSNIEVSYLLQRMEAYRGLAILTTNMRQALDKAFTRRLRFVVQFPYPDAIQRADIWRRVFPSDMPRADLDYAKLARLTVTGGNIRNIALNAAFIAAHEGTPVQMGHLARAARSEYDKLDRPFSHSEVAGWTPKP